MLVKIRKIIAILIAIGIVAGTSVGIASTNTTATPQTISFDLGGYLMSFQTNTTENLSLGQPSDAGFEADGGGHAFSQPIGKISWLKTRPWVRVWNSICFNISKQPGLNNTTPP